MYRPLVPAVACLVGISCLAAACTFFSCAGDDLVLFGNSEDHYDEGALL